MKVYQITEGEAINLLEQLTIEHMQKANFLGVDPHLMGQPINDIHSAYHLIVVRWLQSIGVDRLHR